MSTASQKASDDFLAKLRAKKPELILASLTNTYMRGWHHGAAGGLADHAGHARATVLYMKGFRKGRAVYEAAKNLAKKKAREIIES